MAYTRATRKSRPRRSRRRSRNLRRRTRKLRRRTRKSSRKVARRPRSFAMQESCPRTNLALSSFPINFCLRRAIAEAAMCPENVVAFNPRRRSLSVPSEPVGGVTPKEAILDFFKAVDRALEGQINRDLLVSQGLDDPDSAVVAAARKAVDAAEGGKPAVHERHVPLLMLE